MITSIKKKQLTPYTLVAPVVIFMIAVYGYPLLLTFYYAFHEVSLIGGGNTFVGFKNFQTILTDPSIYKTLILTLKWTVITVLLKIGLGFIFALFLNGNIYFKKVNRFLFLIPWAIPQVAASILWSWMLNGQYGYINYFLENLGLIDKGVYWLSDPNLALISASVVDAWMGIPLIAMMFLSGLTAIPEPLYEAAKVDGAGIVKRFFHITLPSIKKVSLIALTLSTIWSFNSFNVIYVLTGGGPMGGTETIMIKIYKEAFGKYNLGLSSTLSVIVFVILTVLSIFYWKQISKGEE